MRITVNKCLPPGQKKTIFDTFGGGGLPERLSNVLEGGLLCEGTYSFIKIIENFILIKIYMIRLIFTQYNWILFLWRVG